MDSPRIHEHFGELADRHGGQRGNIDRVKGLPLDSAALQDKNKCSAVSGSAKYKGQRLPEGESRLKREANERRNGNAK